MENQPYSNSIFQRNVTQKNKEECTLSLYCHEMEVQICFGVYICLLFLFFYYVSVNIVKTFSVVNFAAAMFS